ncbi:MAG: hypothetical protein IPM39_29465 [Chloroflexi bacterium]|nr:hypothetical protein [Chloroflexota bacterium]
MSDRARAARQEFARRLLAERSLIDFCAYVDPDARISDDGDPFVNSWYRAAHLQLIAHYLELAESGELWRDVPGDGKKTLIITTPPRHWKSSLVSRKFPAWFVGRRKSANRPHQVILASYGATLAEANNRAVLELMVQPRYQSVFTGIQLSSKSQAVNEWSLAGEPYPTAVAAGVGGGLTGQGADVLVIDDPIKDRAEANSATARARLWGWWEDVARTRLNPDGFAVIVLTRWHPDDIVGRLLDQQKREPGAERIVHLRLPALAETPAEREAAASQGLPWDSKDPLNRDPGFALWPERITAEEHEATKRAAPTSFNSLFQGRPSPEGGYVVGRDNFKFLPQAPKTHIKWVMPVDWAYTEKQVAPRHKSDPDFTAVGLLGLWTPSGNKEDARLVLAFADRIQADQHGAKEFVKRSILALGRGVPVRSAQDGIDRLFLSSMRSDPQLLPYSIKNLPHLPGDKVTKATPWMEMAQAGNFYIVVGAWNETFLSSVEQFPHGAHDDLEDMISVGAHYYGLGYKSRQVSAAVVQGFGK